MNIAIAAGGTGGHLFPAISLAKELMGYGCQIKFYGAYLSKNPLFPKEQFPYFECASSPSLKQFFSIAKGVFQSVRQFKKKRPDMIVGFGSYHVLPVLLAAKLCNIPIVLHEQNAHMGKVNRFFAKMSVGVASSFPGIGTEVQFPLRFNPKHERKDPAQFGLSPHKKTVLIMGGSQGALRLNQLGIEGIPLWIKKNVQMIHLTGSKEWEERLRFLYQSNQIPAYVSTFSENMGEIWQSVDFAITRAGASSLFEQLAFGVPGILIPYPYAKDAHQLKNAQVICKTFDSLQVIEQNHLSIEQIENKMHLMDHPRDLIAKKLESLGEFVMRKGGKCLITT